MAAARLSTERIVRLGGAVAASALLVLASARCGESPTAPTVTTVVVTPASTALSAAGATVQLSAQARDAGGHEVGGQTFTWTSADTAVARVSASGLVTAAGHGSAQITATVGTVSGGATVTVNWVAAVVVTPASALLPAVGATVQLSAEAREPDGDPMSGRTFTWTSSDTTKARVSASGLVTAVGHGSATITATVGTVSGIAAVTVNWVASVVVTPVNATLSALGDTIRLSAEAREPDGDPMSGQAFTWASSDTTKARVSASGMVTAVARGSATITAATSGVSGGTSVTINWAVSVEVTPATALLPALGATVQLAAVARDPDGDTMITPSLSWTSSDTTKARVSASGLVTAVGFGSATVTAAAGSASGSTSLTLGRLAARQAARLASGASHTCAISTDGAAYCWGDNSGSLPEERAGSPIPATVPGGRTFQGVSEGNNRVCGLTTAGAAYCWGTDWNGTYDATPVAVPGGVVFQSISTSETHSCGVSTSGTAYCWGDNSFGQLGDGTSLNVRTSPVAVSGGLSFQAISVGAVYHTCGITMAGAAYCWGDNGHGQLGIGTTGGSRTTPAAVAGGLVFQAIAASGLHTCGITEGGDAYCWGQNVYGELGDGGSSERNSPQLVSGGLAFRAISVGERHACALTTSGTAYCWGHNTSGQLGDGTAGVDRAEPVAVAGGLAFQAISAGGRHSCGITDAGAVLCWGENAFGQLGDGTWSDGSRPIGVSGGLSFLVVSPGGGHTCGVATTGGAAYCWGSGAGGQLGNGATTNSASPSAVLGGLAFDTVVAGGTHSCGLTTAGAAYCWGHNDHGQLGDGTTGNRSTPVAVSGGLTFSMISAGSHHSCGLTPQGAAYCWGENSFGSLGDSTEDDHAEPAAVSGGYAFQTITTGDVHTCALTYGGTAYCWGSNESGQLGVAGDHRSSPEAVTGSVVFRAISAGFAHTCGLAVDGTGYCWGDFSLGQLGIGTSPSSLQPNAVLGGAGFVAISAGGNHSCRLTASGVAHCWGENVSAEVGDGTYDIRLGPVAVAGGLTFESIEAGSNHTCALASAGVAYCWGNNGSGQLGAATGFRPTPVAVVGGITFGLSAAQGGQGAPGLQM